MKKTNPFIKKQWIGIVATSMAPSKIGGAQIQTKNLSKQLANKYPTAVFLKRFKNEPKHEIIDKAHIYRCYFKDMRILRPLNFLFHIISTLINIYRSRKKIKILICMMLVPNGLIGILAKALFGIPSVAWVRGGDWYLPPTRLTHFLVKMVIKYSDTILVQSEGTRDSVLSKYPDCNIHIIPNGIDFKTPGSSNETILFVGNLIPRKGAEILIKAMSEIPQETLTIVGDGSESVKLKELAKGTNTVFVGQVPPKNVEFWLHRAKMLVLPSIIGEGFPNVLLEAMATGVPVIASNTTGGITDLITNNKNGLIVIPGNPKELKNAILYLLENPSLRERLAQEGIKTAQSYSWDKIIIKLELIIDRIAINDN
ncbi:MAG: glycosyltransferase family 4 protein [Candidatus Theseobacter exili]|nr:glycosyltransferase family 4 protein [Candidatus Theseobacter exili]